MAEVRLAFEMALAYPRNEEEVRGRLMVACNRYTFADKALYKFPRGNSMVIGPSIKLAEEMARAWGHLRWGSSVVADDELTRTVRGWAWDLQANARKEADVIFVKQVQRKQNGQTVWVTPDPRDLLELSNANGSRASRNALLSLFPWDLLEDVKAKCLDTLKAEDKKDPEAARKRLVDAFAAIGVGGKELEAFVDRPLKQLAADDISELRLVYKGIVDNETTWADAVRVKGEESGLQAPEGTRAPRNAREMRDRVRAQAEALREQQAGPEGPARKEGGS
jgi:hypothetical protein